MTRLLVAICLFSIAALVFTVEGQVVKVPAISKAQVVQLKRLFVTISPQAKEAALSIYVIWTDRKLAEAEKHRQIRTIYNGLSGKPKTEMEQLAKIIFPGGIPN